MNINRQNYEEFFLMYVDNELSGVERSAVEDFVKQNPDLTGELAMLQESVLKPEPIILSNKNDLYKDEHSININNYEEYFLLEVDNELSDAGKAEVEKFVLQHPKLQYEFTLLHQTKLQPEVIEFKNKSVLYRTEKERRVIPITFMRMAVAASVIGLIATLWFVYPGKVETAQPLASTEQPAIKTTGDDKKPGVVEPAKAPVVTAEANSNETLLASNKAATEKRNPVFTVVSNNTNKTPQVQDEQPEELIAKVEPKKEVVKEDTYSETTNTTTTEPTYAINASNKNINNLNASSARPAVYKEVDTDDEDNSFYIGSAEINKNKLRGLMKKAASLFDKKARTDDSEKTIRIASFEIKTK